MTDAEREALIEKMAAEICYAAFTARGLDYGGPQKYWKGVIEDRKKQYRREARAALSVALPIIRADALREWSSKPQSYGHVLDGTP